MQTFLPLPNFAASASVLDRARLGKQRIETKQILQCLLGEGSDAWAHHPAVKMWRGHEMSLAMYGWIVCREWRNRGYKDSQMDWFFDLWQTLHEHGYKSGSPSWFGDAAFHASHRACLLAKDPDHYGQFGWKESPARAPESKGERWPYVWPETGGVTQDGAPR